MLFSVVCVSLGAAAGTCLRWALSGLNLVFPFFPVGTLAANLLGAYIAGVAVALFMLAPPAHPELRLMIMTGFLGALTTFSTFSVEVVMLLQQGRLAWGAATIAANLCGSLALTFLGLGSVALFRSLLS